MIPTMHKFGSDFIFGQVMAPTMHKFLNINLLCFLCNSNGSA